MITMAQSYEKMCATEEHKEMNPKTTTVLKLQQGVRLDEIGIHTQS
jgi:hypothetical protein